MNSQFSPVQFKNMWIDPTKIPQGEDIFEAYPVLKKHKIFTKKVKGIDNTMLMQWIMCVYDYGTPYREKYENIIKRKTEAGRDVGFHINESGLFDKEVDQFMKGQNTTVNAKVVEFVRRHRNMKYSYLVAMENSYYKIMEQVEGGDVTRIKELRSMQEEMETVLIELLNQDENPVVADTVMRYIEEERLALRPEDIALKLSRGETPVQYKEIRK